MILSISAIACTYATGIVLAVPGAHFLAGDGKRGALAALPVRIFGQGCALDIGSSLLKGLQEGLQMIGPLLQ
jgi:hypothetical protein